MWHFSCISEANICKHAKNAKNRFKKRHPLLSIEEEVEEYVEYVYLYQQEEKIQATR